MPQYQHIPGGENTRYLLGDGKFRFDCHSGVVCFTRCCHNADMYLYPYDIIRLKDCLGLTSEEFLAQHTITAFRDNPYFPQVMLKMSEKPGQPCSFLSQSGCRVYGDRPYSCRAYPLEPAFFGDDNRISVNCYLIRHGHCLGHLEEQEWTALQWIRDQEMEDYHEVNARWAQIDSLFRQNPFGEKPLESPALKMAYMASYNMDTFRRFVFDSSFLSRYEVPPRRLEAVRNSDTELLLMGFDWILRFVGGQGPLKERQIGG
ncbi:MAG: YkgJ family cysteine cluster protein [Desulfobacterales bacterium]|nr:YkgJ family cysteine cluster protein [Desulfobacterales bacterium]